MDGPRNQKRYLCLLAGSGQSARHEVQVASSVASCRNSLLVSRSWPQLQQLDLGTSIMTEAAASQLSSATQDPQFWVTFPSMRAKETSLAGVFQRISGLLSRSLHAVLAC